MSSHVGASSANGSNRVGGSEAEEAGEETTTNETHTPEVERSRQRSVDPAGEGRSSNMLVRPALSGRKAHRKTCSEDNKGSGREQKQDWDEERLRAEDLGVRERGEQRERRMTERDETSKDEAPHRQRRESSSSNNFDLQFNNNISEAGEASNNLQRGHTWSRPQSIGCNWSITSNLNSLSPRPAAHARSIPQPPQTPSSRPAAGDLHLHSLSSLREPDPFWLEVRTRSATGRAFTFSELGGDEEDEGDEENVEDGGEGGSGVMRVASQSVTSAVAQPCVSFGERRMSKREKNRIKTLRRRQRRREKWRQSQQQESRQVNDTDITQVE